MISKRSTVMHSTRSITTPSVFNSPSSRLFVGHSPKTNLTEPSEPAMSPTSILETKPFTSFKNPFCLDRKSTTNSIAKHHQWGNNGLVDILSIENTDSKTPKPESRMIVFGSNLKIQIPAVGSMESLHSSPVEFGIKNKPNLSLNSSPRVFTGCLSPKEIELSEDYTCVISHGPNPKTTHIFDNCILESCGDEGFIMLRKENSFWSDRASCSSDDFLSFCFACKKNLEQGKDVFIYRGEKAFCSKECRDQEMLFDEEASPCLQEPQFSI